MRDPHVEGNYDYKKAASQSNKRIIVDAAFDLREGRRGSVVDDDAPAPLVFRLVWYNQVIDRIQLHKFVGLLSSSCHLSRNETRFVYIIQHFGMQTYMYLTGRSQTTTSSVGNSIVHVHVHECTKS